MNLAELLKDCASGVELYSPLFGDCKFVKVHDYEAEIIVEIETGANVSFKTDGRYYDYPNAECLLFPKGKTTWEGFVPPCQLEDGKIVATNNGLFIGIIKVKNNRQVGAYCSIDYSEDFRINSDYWFERMATEDEKEKLFKAIKANGYIWNEETKTLEKLPKFKVGDRLIYIHDKEMYMNEPIYVKRIECNRYILNNGKYIPFYDQDDFELAPNKFDITNLKPFDKVLVRGNVGQRWTIDFFGFMDNNKGYPFVCVGHYVTQCIPYEGNEHLLGTTDDCNDFYKTWE